MKALRSRFSRRPGSRVMRLCAALAALVLAGCGFHLQGSYKPPAGVDALYVAYDNAYRAGEPPLVDTLQQRLRVLGLLGGPGADARLVIESVSTSRSVVSISPVDGDAVEYKLRSTVVFDYFVNGRPRLTGARFALTRFYSYNETVRLAAASERRELIEGMQQRLADRILFRIKQVSERQAANHD